MKIHLDLPWGGHLHVEKEPREPLSDSRFRALAALAAGALVVILFLGSAAIKAMG